MTTYRQFITQISQQMGVSFQGTRIGIVEFADGVFTRLLLSRGTSLQEVTRVISSVGLAQVPDNPGVSDRQVRRALERVIQHWDTSNENRPNYPNAIIYLTGGNPFRADLIAELPSIQQHGATLKGRQQVVSEIQFFVMEGV